MISLKHRAWLGVLALVCLITGFITVFPIPVMNGQAFAATGPDLTIASISLSPEHPSIRDTVTFTTTTKNQGDSAAPQPRIDYYIDNSLIGTALLDTIASDGTATNAITWQASAGDHIIKAIIDGNNDIAETNEDNNEKIYAFSVLAPDLIIESITWSPQIASLGDTVTFAIKVKNHGNKTAGSGLIEFFIDNASRGQREYNLLAPDECTTITYTWITQAGDHTVKAMSDILNQSIESNETNNDLSVIFSTAPPDLIINSILWSPTNRLDTDNVTMHATVKNKGTGTAFPSLLGFYINGSLESTVYIGSLNAGATDTKTFTWTAGPGEQILTAVIDVNNWIYESDEFNNSKSVTMPAVAPPDLLVQSITWTPTQPTTNSYITYTITVKNAGGRTVDTCYLDFYTAYSNKINRKLGPITPGSTVSVDIISFTSTVPINVKAIVDPDNLVAESNETNNEKEASFIPSEPTSTFDFYATSLTCTPQNPIAGQEVVITAKIKNNGNQQAPDSYLAYYVDGIMIQSVLIGKLSARNTRTNSITWISTPGKHTLKVVADYNDSLLEIDESNNAKEIDITTLSADLFVKSIVWSPEIPLKGDALTITFTITNSGTYKSTGCYVNYYADGSYIGNHYVEEILPGDSDTRTIPWTLTNEFQTFKITIDEENSVIESNESNNEKAAIIPAPDLLIESITYLPTEFTENSTVTFSITIRNTGVTPAESPYLDFYINNVFQARLPIVTLASGMSAEALFTWTLLPGKNVLKVIVDGEDNVVEVNETNNEESITLQTMAPVVEIPPPLEEPVEETTENTSANETQEILPMILDTSDFPPAQDANIPVNSSDSISELSGNDLPIWQDIMGNRWIIIGVGVIGIAAISVLLVLRKRAQVYKLM